MRLGYPRRFAGIWIPAEVWLRKDLCPNEKFLLAEIDSLSQQDGCFASNAYFAAMLGTSVRRVKQMLTRLRRCNLIKTKSFDGRKRVLVCLTNHAVDGTKPADGYPAGGKYITRQGGNILPGRGEIYFPPEPKKNKHKDLYDKDLQSEARPLYTSIENSIGNSMYNKEKKYKKKESFIHLFPDKLSGNTVFQKTWHDWELHRKEIGYKLTFQAVKRMVTMLSSVPIDDAIACIETSITKGWRGLFFPQKQIIHFPNFSKEKSFHENDLVLAVQKLSGNSFVPFNWAGLLSEHHAFYVGLESRLKGRYKVFLEERMSSTEEMVKRFALFVLTTYSTFSSIEPQMLRPTGKMFQKFLSAELTNNNVPVTLLTTGL